MQNTQTITVVGLLFNLERKITILSSNIIKLFAEKTNKCGEKVKFRSVRRSGIYTVISLEITILPSVEKKITEKAELSRHNQMMKRK